MLLEPLPPVSQFWSKPRHKPSAYAVSEKSRTPTSEHASHALCTANQAERLHVALVQLRINLSAAFDQIQWRHCCMGETLLIG